MPKYRLLSVEVKTNARIKVGGVDATSRPDLDTVMNAMASDGWELHRFAASGSFVWLVFRRE